jgi:hypothetical protein
MDTGSCWNKWVTKRLTKETVVAVDMITRVKFNAKKNIEQTWQHDSFLALEVATEPNSSEN